MFIEDLIEDKNKELFDKNKNIINPKKQIQSSDNNEKKLIENKFNDLKENIKETKNKNLFEGIWKK